MDEERAPVFRFNFAAASSKPAAVPEHLQNYDKQSSLLVDEDDDQTLLPPPKEVFPSEVQASTPFTTDQVVFQGGYTMLKGKVSTAKVIGLDKADLVPGKYEGGLKLWECTIDLVNTMRREMKDGQLSFRGKRILELGCGHGLPGIFALLKGAMTVHFQDFNMEVLKALTIPNVAANLEEQERKLSSLDSVALAKHGQSEADVRYYAGDWGNVHELLSTLGSEGVCMSGTEEEVFENEGQDHRGINEELLPRPLQRKRSESSRAFEQALLDGPDAGYDIILMSETVYSSASLPKLYNVIKKCLRSPYGVLYVAAKKHYFGVGGGARQFKSLVDNDGILGAHLVTSFVDGSSNVREIWKFFFR